MKQSVLARKQRRGPRGSGRGSERDGLLASEAAFLLRQTQLADQAEQRTSPPPRQGVPRDEAGEARAERLQAEEALEAAERRARQLTLEIGGWPVPIRPLSLTRPVSLRKEHAQRLERLEAAHADELSALERRHAEELAQLVPLETFDGATEKASSSDAEQQLLRRQVEELGSELRRLKGSFADERRELKVELTTKLLVQDRAHRAELQELKDKLASAEDEAVSLSEQLQAARLRASSQQVVQQQLEEGRREDQLAVERLRAELKALQMSTAAAYKDRPRPEEQLGTRLSEAHSEAKARQLQNQLDFLRAQLASEQQTSAEQQQVISDLQQAAESLREETRVVMQDKERLLATAVEETERRVEARFADQLQELNGLRTKLGLLQTQVQEAQVEATLSRQREEASRSAALKTLSQLSVAKAESERLAAQVQELRLHREMPAGETKQSQEAALRRLDNEKQYLKSQLTSEITLKNELQSALTHSQHQLIDVTAQWRREVDELQQGFDASRRGADEREAKLRQTLELSHAENEQLTGQIDELRNALTKLRDQMRMDQFGSESLRDANKRLLSEVESLKDEIFQRSAAEQESLHRHSEQLEISNASMVTLKQEHAEELSKVRSVIGKLQSKVFSISNELVESRVNTAKIRVDQAKVRGATGIFEGIRRIRTTRISKAFRILSSNSLLLDAAAQFREKVSNVLENTLIKAEEDKAIACRNIHNTLNAEKEEALRQLREDFERNFQLREDELSDVKIRQLIELEEQMMRRASEMKLEIESDYRKKLEELSDAAEKANNLQQEKLAQIREENDALLRVERENLATKADIEVQAAKAEVNREWEFRLSVKEAEFRESLNDALKECDERWAERFKQAQIIHNEELSTLKDRLSQESEVVIQNLKVDFQAFLREKNSDWEKVLVRRETEITEDYEKKLAQGKLHAEEALEKAISNLREQLCDEAYDDVVAKEKEWRTRLEQQELVLSNSFDAELKRAIALESEKWSAAMREAELAYRAERVQIRREGWVERDQVAIVEIQQAQKHSEEIRSTLEMKHLQEIEQLHAKYQREALDDRMEAEDRFEKLEQQVKSAEEKTRLVEVAHANLQQYIESKEEELNSLRAEVSGMKRSFEIVSEAVSNKDRMIRSYAKRLQDELAKERAASEVNVTETKMETEKRITSVWVERMNHRESELMAECEKKILLEKTSLDEKLRAAVEAHEAMTRKLKDDIATKVRGTLIEVERKRKEEMENLERALRAEKLEELERERQHHQDDLGTLRRKMNEDAEKRIRELRELWEDESFDMRKEFEREFTEKSDFLLREAAIEADRIRIRSLELEASKWQKLLDESENKLEMAVQMARAAGWDARDNQAKEEISQLNHRIHELSSKSDTVDNSLEELERRHVTEKDTIVKTLTAEFDAKIIHEVAAEQRRCEETFSERLKALEDEYEKKIEILTGKIIVNEKLLAEAKVDFSLQISRLAQERSDLFEAINQRESQVAQLREAHSSEKEDLRQEVENDRILREMQQQRLHKLALQELQSKYENAMEEAEAKWDRIADNRVKAEITALTLEKDSLLASLKSQYEADLNRLEDSTRTLKVEKEQVELKLKNLSAKLEENEDRLYDEQQKVLAVVKQAAFHRWNAVVIAMQLKSNLKDEILRKEREMASQMTRAASENTARLNLIVVAVLKLAALVDAADVSRRKTHRTLTQYKADMLVERRSKIRLFEKELERMNNEKKALEAERSRFEQDIAQLSQQVADLEDQIHEHNRFSAMQNGRINVPHVRKKRRLDNELEKLLELIEIKRGNLSDFDEKILLKDQERNEKEMSLVEIERDLMNVLIEQQRSVLQIVEEDRKFVESGERIMDDAGLPWPPPTDFTSENALTFLK